MLQTCFQLLWEFSSGISPNFLGLPFSYLQPRLPFSYYVMERAAKACEEPENTWNDQKLRYFKFSSLSHPGSSKSRFCWISLFFLALRAPQVYIYFFKLVSARQTTSEIARGCARPHPRLSPENHRPTVCPVQHKNPCVTHNTKTRINKVVFLSMTHHCQVTLEESSHPRCRNCIWEFWIMTAVALTKRTAQIMEKMPELISTITSLTTLPNAPTRFAVHAAVHPKTRGPKNDQSWSSPLRQGQSFQPKLCSNGPAHFKVEHLVRRSHFRKDVAAQMAPTSSSKIATRS